MWNPRNYLTWRWYIPAIFEHFLLSQFSDFLFIYLFFRLHRRLDIWTWCALRFFLSILSVDSSAHSHKHKLSTCESCQRVRIVGRWVSIRRLKRKKIFGKHGKRVGMRTFQGVVISLGIFFLCCKNSLYPNRQTESFELSWRWRSREYNCNRVKGIRRFDFTMALHCVASSKIKYSIRGEWTQSFYRSMTSKMDSSSRSSDLKFYIAIGSNAVEFDTCQNRIRLSMCPVGSCLY